MILSAPPELDLFSLYRMRLSARQMFSLGLTGARSSSKEVYWKRQSCATSASQETA